MAQRPASLPGAPASSCFPSPRTKLSQLFCMHPAYLPCKITSCTVSLHPNFTLPPACMHGPAQPIPVRKSSSRQVLQVHSFFTCCSWPREISCARDFEALALNLLARMIKTVQLMRLSKSERELKDLKENEDSPVGLLKSKGCTLDQGKAVISFFFFDARPCAAQFPHCHDISYTPPHNPMKSGAWPLHSSTMPKPCQHLNICNSPTIGRLFPPQTIGHLQQTWTSKPARQLALVYFSSMALLLYARAQLLYLMTAATPSLFTLEQPCRAQVARKPCTRLLAK